MRLIFHTAAFWLMWRIQQEIPKATALATAEFATLRLRLLKVAARVIESTTRIRVAFASACPDAALFQSIATACSLLRHSRRGRAAESLCPLHQPRKPLEPPR